MVDRHFRAILPGKASFSLSPSPSLSSSSSFSISSSHLLSRSLENTSYSAMLNIAKSVPPPEPVPSNSGHSFIIQYNRSSRHWPSSIKFPEFRNRMGFSEFLSIPELEAIPRNSGTGWNFGNSAQFRLHPILGIPYRNSFRPSPSRILLWATISLRDK